MSKEINSAKAEEQYANAAVANCNNSIYDGEMMTLFSQHYYDYGHSMMDFLMEGKLKECNEGVYVDEYVSMGCVIKNAVYNGVRIVDEFPVIEEGQLEKEITSMFGALDPHEMRTMITKALCYFNEGVMDRSEELIKEEE